MSELIGVARFLEAQQRRRNVASAQRIAEDVQGPSPIPPLTAPKAMAAAVVVGDGPVARWRAPRPPVPER